MHDLLSKGRRRPRALIAPTRRHDAAQSVADTRRGKGAHDLWQEAAKIRQEWLGHGLSSQPADRHTAERSLTAIYEKIARPRPRFAWVESPVQAIPLVAGWPTLDGLYAGIRDPHPRGAPPLASDLAMVASQLRGALSAGVSHPDPELSPVRRGKAKGLWPELPPLKALEAGVPLGVMLHQGIQTALHRSLAHGFRNPVRDALASNGPIPVCWYGQQDATWVAYYDALQELGLASYGPKELDHLGHWAALARSCGWWWPGRRRVHRSGSTRTDPHRTSPRYLARGSPAPTRRPPLPRRLAAATGMT